MDIMLNKLSGILERFAAKIPALNIPWEKYTEYMNTITPYLAQANVIFPVDALLKMVVIFVAYRAVLFIIWTISFIRGLLPF